MSRFSLNGGLKPVPVPFMSDNTGRGITRGLQHPHHHQLNGVLLNPGSNPALAAGGVHSGSRPNSRNGVIRQHRSRSRSKSRQRSRSNRASAAVPGSAGQTSSNPSGSNGSGSGQSDTNPYSSNNGSTSRLVGTKF